MKVEGSYLRAERFDQRHDHRLRGLHRNEGTPVFLLQLFLLFDTSLL